MDFVGNPIETTAAGSLWAVWLPDDAGQRVFGRLGAAGWQQVGEWPFNGDLMLSDLDDIWTVGWTSNIFETYPRRFVDGAWQTYEDVGNPGDPATVGPDGTLWAVDTTGLTRFDGTDWQTFRRPDWLAKEPGRWLVDDVQLPMVDSAYGASDADRLQLPELGRPACRPRRKCLGHAATRDVG